MIAQGSRMNSRASRRASKQQHNRNQEGKDDEYTRNLRTFYELCWISPAEEQHIEETLHALDEWGFDGIQGEEMIGKMAVPIVFCRLATMYDFLGSLSLDSELLCNFTKKVQSGFSEFSLFHGSGRALDMIQAVHYFQLKGLGVNWLNRNVDMLRFTLFTAALVANCGHPGYTTEFLVKTRHLRALRYNDQNILRNHTMAFISQQLSDPETNFALQWEPAQAKHFRELLIRMVLKLDLHRHFQELGELNTKVSSDMSYPQDTLDDRTSMACFALRAADLACRARPNNIYNRWIERHAEENFSQGDMERQFGVSISAFCDRDAVNIDKMEYAVLSIIVSPYLSAFALVFDNRQWPGCKELQKEVIDDGEATNRTLLHEKLVKEAQGTLGRH